MGQFQISHSLPQYIYMPFCDVRFIDLPRYETTTMVEHVFIIPPYKIFFSLLQKWCVTSVCVKTLIGRCQVIFVVMI